MLINQIDLLDVKVEYRLKERDLQTVCGGYTGHVLRISQKLYGKLGFSIFIPKQSELDVLKN